MDFVDLLQKWYPDHHRDLPWRKTRDPYAIWVSEIMLQQTRVAAVIPYYERFTSELPNVSALAAVPDDRLNLLWQGLGYYSRARNLKRAAQIVCERYAGRMPDTYETLLSLPGIGSYTAGAIASIAYGERVPAVDGNVLRVYARVFNDPSDVSDPAVKTRVFDELKAVMPADPGTFNQALMELGALVCVPNGQPLCADCPLASVCKAREAGTAGLLPNKSPKKPRAIEDRTVFALYDAGAPLLLKRPDKGLLAGLYELPNVSGTLSTEKAMEWLTAHGLHPVGDLLSYSAKHVFTHIEWHMRVYAADVAGEGVKDFIRSDGSRSIPTAFSVCLPKAGRMFLDRD
ncbi:MAG: A/G-specific adenine glycosylase [Clostridia bacterium]|nr:A/G-specific adenine glycosylase [Clostridia bacterium]